MNFTTPGVPDTGLIWCRSTPFIRLFTSLIGVSVSQRTPNFKVRRSLTFQSSCANAPRYQLRRSSSWVSCWLKPVSKPMNMLARPLPVAVLPGNPVGVVAKTETAGAGGQIDFMIAREPRLAAAHSESECAADRDDRLRAHGRGHSVRHPEHRLERSQDSHNECAGQGHPAAATTGSGDTVLKVDGGSLNFVFGLASDTAVFVNRLTPPAYPATLKNVQIYFGNRTNGLAAGTSIQVIAATNPSGSASI